MRCHREQWVPCGLPCVCVAAFTSVRHCCVPAHLQSLGKAVQCSSTKLWQRACAGEHPWEHPGSQGRDPLPGWNSPSGSCTASPPGLRFSFLAFPQLPLLTGSSMLCPGNQLPLTTQGGNSFLSSSLVFSHTKSQKVKKKLGGQPELDLFPFHVLIPLFNPQELHYKLTDFHPNPQTSTPKPQTLQTRLSSHPSHGPSQADTAQVGQLKVTELGESSPCSCSHTCLILSSPARITHSWGWSKKFYAGIAVSTAQTHASGAKATCLSCSVIAPIRRLNLQPDPAYRGTSRLGSKAWSLSTWSTSWSSGI